MAKLSPYFAFENAKEAMSYYEKVFGATHLARIPVGKEMANNLIFQKIRLNILQCMVLFLLKEI